MPGDSATQALNGQLTVPAGFKVAYFATHLPGVRFMALGADGAVYASQPSAGRVVRIWDVNGDGVADSVATAVGGLDRPHGLAFHGGFLYIANTGSVVRVRLGGDGRAAGAPEALVQFDGGGMHWTRSLAFGADSMMYVAMGSTCNVCVETDPMRAAVTRYDANGENGSRFAYGLRNAVGIAVNPATKAIWVSQNERDNLAPDHENLPPDEINILLEGGDYGWPYCYTHGGAPVPNPEYHDASRCTATIPATLEIQAHSAPLGMTFLDRATAFPDDYRGDLLAALHGSWNRGVPTGAKVVRIHVTNGIPVSAEDFVSGWQRADGSRWGRPADVMVYRDGSVLVSDDQGGAIFRVYR
jgi:glucose/arabinose dehydrogenase